MRKQASIKFSLYLKKEDIDISDWLNHVSKSGQSVSKWISAMLVAYQNNEIIPLGLHTRSSPDPEIQSLFGSGATDKNASKKKQLFISPSKGAVYDTGKYVNFELASRKAISAYSHIKGLKLPVSSVIRAMIRAGMAIPSPSPTQVYKTLSKYLGSDIGQMEDDILASITNNATVFSQETTTSRPVNKKPVMEAPVVHASPPPPPPKANPTPPSDSLLEAAQEPSENIQDALAVDPAPTSNPQPVSAPEEKVMMKNPLLGFI